MMFVRALVVAALLLVPLCVGAGRWDIGWFYAYAALFWLTFGLVYSVAPPDLVAERLKPPSDRDKRSRRIALPLAVAHAIVAGLDARFGWSDVSLALRILGFAFVGTGLGFAGWTILSNPFASSAVRIQSERGHRLITTGPYAFVRHPMYLGVFALCLGSGLALGSYWAAISLVPILPVFVRRTLLEDHMLHGELAGYPDYATKVRWRVVPGVF